MTRSRNKVAFSTTDLGLITGKPSPNAYKYEFRCRDIYTDEWGPWQNTSLDSFRKLHRGMKISRGELNAKPYFVSTVDGVERRWRKKA